jgi:hypothetical protein
LPAIEATFTTFPPTGRHHVGQDSLGAEERRARVHVHEGVPVLFRDVQRERRAVDARVVDQDVDAPERVHCSVGQRRPIGPAGHIRSDGEDPAARGSELAGGAVGSLRIAIGHRDGRAPRGQFDRDGAPDPLASPRDNGHLAVELSFHPRASRGCASAEARSRLDPGT